MLHQSAAASGWRMDVRMATQQTKANVRSRPTVRARQRRRKTPFKPISPRQRQRCGVIAERVKPARREHSLSRREATLAALNSSIAVVQRRPNRALPWIRWQR